MADLPVFKDDKDNSGIKYQYEIKLSTEMKKTAILILVFILAGQIDSQWPEEIKKDFLYWLNNYPGKLPMTKSEPDNYLKERNF